MNYKNELKKLIKELGKKIADGNATKKDHQQYQKYYIAWALRD